VKGNKWQVEEDLVLKEEKVYISKNKELRVEIIQLHHDVLVAGYRERWKMEDNKVGDKKLLVARDNKRCWKICR